MTKSNGHKCDIRLVERLFCVVLILNATGLFVFIAPVIDVTIGEVTVMMFLLNVVYLLVNARILTVLLRRGEGTRVWLVIMLAWPLFTLLYAPSLEYRSLGLRMYSLSLIYGAGVYTLINGLPKMHRVMAVSLALTIFGLVLSMLAPQYFEAVSDLADANVLKEGRACGFLLQPNSLARGIGFLFIGWFALWKEKNTLFEVPAVLTFLSAMLLTGSRTGVLMGLIVVGLILVPPWKDKAARAKYVMKMALLTICVVAGIVCAKYCLSQVETSDPGTRDLVTRMDTMLSFHLSDDGSIGEDGSVRERVDAQTVYWSLLHERPFLGYGLGADAYLARTIPRYVAAHSEALTNAVEYGSLYPIALGLLIWQLYRKPYSRGVERAFQTNSILQFVLVFLFLFTISAGLFGSRTFDIVLGMLLATTYCPHYLFRYDATTGTILAVLTRPALAAYLPNGLTASSYFPLHGNVRMPDPRKRGCRT